MKVKLRHRESARQQYYTVNVIRVTHDQVENLGTPGMAVGCSMVWIAFRAQYSSCHNFFFVPFIFYYVHWYNMYFDKLQDYNMPLSIQAVWRAFLNDLLFLSYDLSLLNFSQHFVFLIRILSSVIVVLIKHLSMTSPWIHGYDHERCVANLLSFTKWLQCESVGR